jgi:hypothetical protein
LQRRSAAEAADRTNFRGLRACCRPVKAAAQPIAPHGQTPQKTPSKARSLPGISSESAAAESTLERIAAALERLAPSAPAAPAAAADAFSRHPDGAAGAVPKVNRVEMSLLKGTDRMRDVLVENTSVLPADCLRTPCCGARAAWQQGRARSINAAQHRGKTHGNGKKATGCSSSWKSIARTSKACRT